MPALRRTTLPVLFAFLGLLWPATAGAAQPTVGASADVGTVAVAQAMFKTRGGGTALPRLALARRGLPSGALVVGGVKKVRRGRYLASLAVIRPSARTPGARAAAAAAVRAGLRMPRGTRFAGFVSRATATDVGNRAAPRSLCRALPGSFSHGAARPLAGTPLSGFDARTTLRNAFWLGCRDWSGRAEFINALGARGVTASPVPAGGSGGSGGGEDEAGSGDGSLPPECQPDPSVCDPADGPPKSTTLTGSGSVTRDAGDPNLYRYSVQFNEPIRGYRFEIPRTSLECPTDKTYDPNYSKCQGIPDAQRPSAGGADLRCTGGEMTNHLLCAIAQSRGGSAVTIPAGTTITGSFTVSAGSVSPGSIQVYGENAQGGEAATPFALAGPG